MMTRHLAAYTLALTVVFAALGTAQNIASVAAAGDSITKAFNAQSAYFCPNTDQEYYNWATADTNGSGDPCSPGIEGVFSVTEHFECLQQNDVMSPYPNQARSGAQMLKDFVNQANAIKGYISLQPAPRLTTVLLGHNDICGGKLLKYNWGCPRGSDQDWYNHCRTNPGAFEREFRKGLDILITVPDMKIAVLSLVRVSQLCNFGNKQTCQFFSNCTSLWRTATVFDAVFGAGNGICGSLTIECSSTRIADAYHTALVYRYILQAVTAEYAAIPPGGTSPVKTVGGQTVGGAPLAPGTTLVYSDAPWRYKFNSWQLSCCDCFHPSWYGQDTLARIAFSGLLCTNPVQCCADTGNPVVDGSCSSIDQSGTYYPGIF